MQKEVRFRRPAYPGKVVPCKGHAAVKANIRGIKSMLRPLFVRMAMIRTRYCR